MNRAAASTQTQSEDSPVTMTEPETRANGKLAAADVSHLTLDGPEQRIADEAPASSIFDDLESCRIDVDEGFIRTVEQLVHIPIKRPHKQWFIRCCPDPAMSLGCTVFEDDNATTDRESYFVAPAMRPRFDGFCRIVLLHLCVNSQGVHFLWPVAIADGGGPKGWSESARAIADKAKMGSRACRQGALRLSPRAAGREICRSDVAQHDHQRDPEGCLW
jgi:hypothetical protein